MKFQRFINLRKGMVAGMSDRLDIVYDKIYKYCYYKMENKQIAEDITQETFLKYFAQNIKIEQSRQMAYLYTIAKNLCMDHFRKRKGEENREEWKGDKDWRTEDFSKDLEKKFVLRQAMRSLEEKQQEVLFLRYVNEVTVKETALFMGISRFAVYRLEKAALLALQQILRKEDFYE